MPRLLKRASDCKNFFLKKSSPSYACFAVPSCGQNLCSAGTNVKPRALEMNDDGGSHLSGPFPRFPSYNNATTPYIIRESGK